MTVGNNLTVTGALVPASSFKRNRIINGNMQIWQRNTTFTIGSNSWTYTSDRMAVFSTNSSTTVSQNTSVPANDFQYSLKLQRTAGNAQTNTLNLAQVVESLNCYDLSGKSVTLSFYAKSGANYSGGNLGVQVITGTVADQGVGNVFGSWTGSATPINTSTAITTTWTRYTFTGTFGSGVLEAAALLYYTPSGTAGADDSVYITGVQLEVGTKATPYEMQIYSDQLAQCQRYFQQPTAWGGMGDSANSISAILPYIVQMRTAPTVSAISGATLSWRIPGADASTTTWSLTAVNAFYNGVWLLFGGLGVATTAGASYQNRYLLGGNYLVNLSAEL